MASPPQPKWRAVFHVYSSRLEPSPPQWSRITHFKCKKVSNTLFATFLYTYYLLQTQHFNFFFEKYYKAHTGTKLLITPVLLQYWSYNLPISFLVLTLYNSTNKETKSESTRDILILFSQSIHLH